MLQTLKDVANRIAHFHCTKSVAIAVGRNMELSAALLSELSLADLNSVSQLNTVPQHKSKEQ